MLPSIPEFFKKLDQSFLTSSITAFYGANSKFNYIRIGLLGDMQGDDALDYLLASNSLCELVIIPGDCSNEHGEFALIVDPNRPETARIISNSDNTNMPLGLENVVEYLKEILGYTESKAFAVAAILTPPDPITQIGLALPLLLLYEVSIYIVKMIEKKHNAQS